MLNLVNQASPQAHTGGRRRMRVVEVSFPDDGHGEISFPISRTISGNGLDSFGPDANVLYRN